MEEKDRLVVSFSSLNTYSQCPYGYYLKYVVRESQETADYTGTVPGNVAHKLAEMFFKHKEETGELKWSVFEEEFDNTFFKYAKSPTVDFKTSSSFAKNIVDAKEKVFNWSQNLKRMLDSHMLVDGYTISEFRFGSYKNPAKITDILYISGGPDLFHSESEDSYGRLVDYKASDTHFHLNEKQLYLYGLAAEKTMNLKVSMVGFLLFKSSKTILFCVLLCILIGFGIFTFM